MSVMDPQQSRTDERHRIQLTRQWGEWLDQSRWSHFSNLSFDAPTSAATASRRFNRWIARLEERFGVTVNWVYFVERSPAGLIHLHALLNLPPWVSLRTLQRSWYSGDSKHAPYERGQGASSYIAKELNTARLEEYDISAILVPYVP